MCVTSNWTTPPFTRLYIYIYRIGWDIYTHTHWGKGQRFFFVFGLLYLGEKLAFSPLASLVVFFEIKREHHFLFFFSDSSCCCLRQKALPTCVLERGGGERRRAGTGFFTLCIWSVRVRVCVCIASNGNQVQDAIDWQTLIGWLRKHRERIEFWHTLRHSFCCPG